MTSAEATDWKLPRDIVAGQDYVLRARVGELRTTWYKVVEVKWLAGRKAYYVKIDRPDAMRNALADHFHIPPRRRLGTRTDDGTTGGRFE